ncbi:hypothetical protein BZG36_04729 [Bifiguratus adelaidae]|uniref:SnoaL-like domain-containing protein n=1 Tax=Bifiguratus adelaidae TaxID=1938954 RepID=A0A261XUF0_9FUNG|nr:hypothetical protein BZG36_04729 [Bifiguratus adelaidae]
MSDLASLQEIQDLLQGWMYRDLNQWDKLEALFHDDGEIEITWFEGRLADFVEGSAKMGASDLRTKHMISPSLVQFNGGKAIVETNCIIVGANIKRKFGCNAHGRFYDRIEQRKWGLEAYAAADIDYNAVQEYPREYAALAYLLTTGGFPVKRIFPTRDSDQEKSIKVQAQRWLHR